MNHFADPRAPQAAFCDLKAHYLKIFPINKYFVYVLIIVK